MFATNATRFKGWFSATSRDALVQIPLEAGEHAADFVRLAEVAEGVVVFQTDQRRSGGGCL